MGDEYRVLFYERRQQRKVLAYLLIWFFESPAYEWHGILIADKIDLAELRSPAMY